VSGDTLQYSLEESVSHRRRLLDRWHNSLLSQWRYKQFISCIRRCLLSCACDWVMPALSAMLLIFQFPIQSAFLQYIAH